MTATKKALAATLKDINTAFHTIGAGSASELSKEYNTTKANYFYGKAEEDVEKWLTKIDQMIKDRRPLMISKRE